MIGPAGQERTEELVFLVPAVQVPPGEWRYALGGGACRAGGCTAIGYADVRRGVARNLTLGLGVDHVARDTLPPTRVRTASSASTRGPTCARSSAPAPARWCTAPFSSTGGTAAGGCRGLAA
jgi:hypothetical protein